MPAAAKPPPDKKAAAKAAKPRGLKQEIFRASPEAGPAAAPRGGGGGGEGGGGTPSAGRVPPPGPRYEPGSGYTPSTAPAPPSGPLWLLQLPADWEPATVLTLDPTPGHAGGALARGTDGAGGEWALFAEDPACVAGVVALGPGGAATPVAARATLVRVSAPPKPRRCRPPSAPKADKKLKKREKEGRKKRA